jgi:hypothetical protein
VLRIPHEGRAAAEYDCAFLDVECGSMVVVVVTGAKKLGNGLLKQHKPWVVDYLRILGCMGSNTKQCRGLALANSAAPQLWQFPSASKL